MGNGVSCLKPKYEKKYEQRQWRKELHKNDSIFSLPGMGEQTHDYCGEWSHALSCPDYAGGQVTLDGMSHDRFVIMNSCHNPTCPVCYPSWASRQAGNTSDKMIQSLGLWKAAGWNLGRINHIVFSPPQEKAAEMIKTVDGARRLRTEAIKRIKSAGVVAGAVVFHPFRQNDPREPEDYREDLPEYCWYISPHFHVLGCGYLVRSDNFYAATGWVYKKLDRRATIKGTVFYTLTHCGIVDGFQAIVYFGAFANNVIVIEKQWTAQETIKCRACGKALHEYDMSKSDENDALSIDYDEDLGVYYHKVTHKIYKISEKALARYKDRLKNNDLLVVSGGYRRIDVTEIHATRDRLKAIIRMCTL